MSWFSMIAAIISDFTVFHILFFRFSKYALTLWSTVFNISQARKNRLLFFLSNSILFPINSLFTRSISCRCRLMTFPYRRLLRTGVLHRGHCFRLIPPSSWSIQLSRLVTSKTCWQSGSLRNRADSFSSSPKKISLTGVHSAQMHSSLHKPQQSWPQDNTWLHGSLHLGLSHISLHFLVQA